jgi:tubulin polyglutamylase TTLL2
MGDLKYDQQSVLQKYIANPLLIRGLKWDMRIYVAIPQMRPMKLYLYAEGLVRFSTDRYDKSQLDNQFSHLTNSSINKYAHGAGQDGSQVYDNKWTLEQLKHCFASCGWDYASMWTKIEKIIILTCVNLCASCPNYDNCFELLGFDVMVDDKLKPWLLEVNSSPAMSMDGAADSRVKPDLLRDTFKIIDFEPAAAYHERMKI